MGKDQNYMLRANNIPRVSRRNLDPDEVLARNVFTLKPTIITQRCRTCHELKPLNDFYLVSASKTGRRTETECIPCWDHRSRINKIKIPETKIMMGLGEFYLHAVSHSKRT